MENEKNIIEETEELNKKIEKSEKSVKAYQYFAIRVLVLLVAIWILFFQIIGLLHMPNNDMTPRLDANDLILFYRLDKDVRAQDVIVIQKSTPDSDGEKKLYVLRVVAVEGDTVNIEKERLVINDHTMIEPKIYYNTWNYEDYTQYPVTLGKDECFVLADMREGGEDSRYFGVVKKKEILGSVITIIRRQEI